MCITIYMNLLNEEVCPMHTRNRWPVQSRGQKFNDRLELLTWYIQYGINPDPNMFLPSQVYFIRAALEEKFQRHFSISEVNRIIKDKSWQWRDAPSQAL